MSVNVFIDYRRDINNPASVEHFMLVNLSIEIFDTFGILTIDVYEASPQSRVIGCLTRCFGGYNL